MRKRIRVLLTALILTLALTACGSSDRNRPQDSSRNDAAAEDGLMDDGAAVTPDQTPAVTDDPDQQPGVPLDEMLENARVRDKDGDLSDGENRADHIRH